MTLDRQERNKKLAEFAGFKACSEEGCEDLLMRNEGEQDEEFLIIPLTESLDACFKWLVLEFFKRYGYVKTFEMLRSWVGSLLDVTTGVNEEAALALCLAIEKFVDNPASSY